MENITRGHWIFAAIFALSFIGYMIYAYRKDLKMHKTYYRGATLIFFFLLFGMVVLYLLKDNFQ